jgi:uncharacterized protein
MPKSKLEKLFAYKKTILILMFLITLVLGFNAKNIRSDFSVDPQVSYAAPLGLEKLFRSKSAAEIALEDNIITVVVHDKNLFSINSLKRMKVLEAELTRNNFVLEVNSLYSIQDANSYFFDETKQTIITGKETTKEDVDYAKYQATHNRLLLSRLINSQATTVAFYVTLKQMSQAQTYQARDAIESILQGYQSKFGSIFQIGDVEVHSYLFQSSKHDAKTIGVLALLTLVLIYGVFFGRLVTGLLPFITSALAMIWTGGILALLDVPLNLLSSLAVVLVFIIGAMECAHLINTYQRIRKEKPGEDNTFYAACSLKHVFWPIFFATVTTMMGFACNIFSSVKLLEDFAATICLAIFANSLLICLLLPLLLGFCSKNSKKISDGDIFSVVSNVVLKIHKKIIAKSIVVIIILFAILSCGIILAPKIPIEVAHYINLYESSPPMIKIKNISKYLTGVKKLEVYVEGDQSDAFRSKKNLDELLVAQKDVSELPGTSSTFSMATVIASLFQVYMSYGDDSSEYRIPDSNRFVDEVLSAQDKFPFVGKLLAKDNQVAKIDIFYKIYTTPALYDYVHKISKILDRDFADTSLSYEMQNTALGRVNDIMRILKIQVISIFVIYLAVFLVMWCLFRTYKAGIVAIVPNFFPLASILVLMYFLRIPFFPMTIIVLVSVLGIAVDDTIHIMLSFKKFYKKIRDIDSAIESAVRAQMRPVTITSISLIVAISFFAFSSLKSIMLFSVLLCFGALMAWVSDMVVTPFMLKKINIIKKLDE